jgi:hypothetical protein
VVVLGKSGKHWDLDERALREDGQALLVIEVTDVGASGGTVVSPWPCRSSAELVAKAAGIEHVGLKATEACGAEVIPAKRSDA